MITAPRIPVPTTLIPITPPEEKATRRAGFKPLVAAAAVRIFAWTAIRIPIMPVSPEAKAPTKYAIEVSAFCPSNKFEQSSYKCMTRLFVSYISLQNQKMKYF